MLCTRNRKDDLISCRDGDFYRSASLLRLLSLEEEATVHFFMEYVCMAELLDKNRMI